jgi:conjugal transfer/entry exclusion protein
MVDAKRAAVAAAVWVCMAHAPAVQAMPVLDVANLIQNLTAARHAAQQVASAYQQIKLQQQQLQSMREQLRSMNPSQIAGILGDVTGVEDLHKLEKTLAANRDLIGSIDKVRKGIEARLDTAKLMKMTWKEYVAWEMNRVARKEESAVARINAEVHAMKRIEEDYAFAREQGARIAGTAGTHEAMQLMNVQMNRLIQQSAEVVRQLSTAFGRAAAEKELQEAEDKARVKAQEDALRTVVTAAREADRAAVEAWNTAKKP